MQQSPRLTVPFKMPWIKMMIWGLRETGYLCWASAKEQKSAPAFSIGNKYNPRQEAAPSQGQNSASAFFWPVEYRWYL
jgi:hypothetical protein